MRLSLREWTIPVALPSSVHESDSGARRVKEVFGLSVVIPTFNRGAFVVDSIQALLAVSTPPLEIVVVDQTLKHPPDITTALTDLADSGRIRWLRLDRPSIPHAMNVGLKAARGGAVLFLDDDIIPDNGLVEAHSRAQETPGLVAGHVMQPGQDAVPLALGETFRFNSTQACLVNEFIGCNFSVDKGMAIALGGFDENFIGAAFRYEAEFSHRFRRKYGKIRFEPSASIRHLAIPTGGTRAYGNHLRTLLPIHSVGAYYCLLRTRERGWWWQILWRPLRAVRTRHHLRRPWWIPLTLVAEARGFLLALRLYRRGPKLIEKLDPSTEPHS